MLFDVNKIQEDADMMARNKSKGAESQAGSTWVKFYDPLYKDYFFYNEITGEKVEAKGLSQPVGSRSGAHLWTLGRCKP